MKTELDFPLIYEDKKILVAEKRAGLLTIATDKEKEKTLYHQVRSYANLHREKIFIVHRLDKDTSGLVLFAKSIPMKEKLQKAFEEHRVKRYYEAVVREKIPLGTTKRIVQYLYYDRASGLVRTTKDKKFGKEAVTIYTADNALDIGTALRIEILTGRQHQIRLALRDLGLTLIGDQKYAHDKAKRMLLNEYELVLPESLGLKERCFALTPSWLKKER